MNRRTSQQEWTFLAGLAAGACLGLWVLRMTHSFGRSRSISRSTRAAAASSRTYRPRQGLASNLVNALLGLLQAFGLTACAEGTGAATATLALAVDRLTGAEPGPVSQLRVCGDSGVLVLRGAVDRPEQIRVCEAEVRRIAGVVDVVNLLELSGSSIVAPRTTPPN